jgi:hypothetical protein
MARYEVISGEFPCHTCKKVVTSLRMYPETKQLTWMCPERHMSTVDLSTKKKSRKDYEREV